MRHRLARFQASRHLAAAPSTARRPLPPTTCFQTSSSCAGVRSIGSSAERAPQRQPPYSACPKAPNGRISGASQTESAFPIWKASNSSISARDRRWLGVTAVTPAARPSARRPNRALFFSTGSSAPALMGAYFSALCSALQKLLLFLHLRPFIGVRRRGLALDDGLPGFGELGGDGDPVALRGRDVILGKDRFDGALRDAQGAVDALLRVDHQHVGALAKAVDRAHVDAVGVLALDAALSDDVCHGEDEPARPERFPRISRRQRVCYHARSRVPPFCPEKIAPYAKRVCAFPRREIPPA